MEKNEYFEYYDYGTKKFKILNIFSKENIQNTKIYKNIIEYANEYFLGYGLFHKQIQKYIKINIPLYIKDNKIKIYHLDKNIQSNINKFLSVSIKIHTKTIDNYYILNKYIDEDIIITHKYKFDGNKDYNKFQFYSYGINGYYQNGIYYTIEEYSYRPQHYIINTMVYRIFYSYIIIIIIFILMINYLTYY